ncbi:hypothetical protein DPMN_177176 [Dreissena polymorpha]|uniref:Uncharacterized protein n=1 Tax=Dreissena polymorpha TaxID=45954 RepID=A0A9D4ECI8_DREPO|nr:hypothetical protein DPMN_177176 [Dreissena polymorpha]
MNSLLAFRRVVSLLAYDIQARGVSIGIRHSGAWCLYWHTTFRRVVSLLAYDIQARGVSIGIRHSGAW